MVIIRNRAERSGRLRRTMPAALLAVAATVAVAALGLAVAPAPARADTRPPVLLRIGASHSRIDAGSTVVLTSRVVRDGRPLAGRTVVLQRRTVGTTRWHDVRKVVTDARGRVLLRTRPLLRDEEFRLRHRARSGTASSNVVAVVVPVWITGSIRTPLTINAGAPVELAGTASGGFAGARIFLQTEVESAWRTIASSVVADDASWVLRAKATRGGEQRFRAWIKAAPGRPEIASTPADLTVYAWYRLAELPLVPSSSGFTIGRAEIATGVDEQSLVADLSEGGDARATFDLDERCTTFRGRLGAIGDAGFTARWRLHDDDEVPVDEVLSGGTATGSAVDITGTSLLHLQNFGRKGAGTAVWANPEVLCAGRP